MADRIITGIEQVDRKLLLLATKDANRIARSGLNAGLTSLARTIRREIDAEPISRELKKALKLTVGKRLENNSRRFDVGAKAGFGVGKNTRAKKAQIAKRKLKRGTAQRKGVGISSANVHWFALGTARRSTNSPRRSVGAIRPVQAVRRAAGSAASFRRLIDQKCRERIEQILG